MLYLSLYIHLSIKLLKTDNEANASEHYEIARWLDYIGEKSSAFSAYQSLMGKEPNNKDEAKYNLSLHYKKQKEWIKAEESWKEIIHSSNNKTIICKASIELAKYYEHKEKNYKDAIHYSELVKKMVFESEQMLLKSDIPDLDKRINRLQRKYSESIARVSAKNE